VYDKDGLSQDAIELRRATFTKANEAILEAAKTDDLERDEPCLNRDRIPKGLQI
jgi:hypothetical protein